MRPAAVVAVAALLALATCVNVDAYRFGCDEQGQCPNGQVCARDKLCYAPGELADASVAFDASFDAATNDAGIDASTDSGAGDPDASQDASTVDGGACPADTRPFSDGFDNPAAGLWTMAGSGSKTYDNGQLTVTTTGAVGSLPRWTTTNAFNFDGGAAFVQVVEADAERTFFWIQDVAKPNAHAGFEETGGRLDALTVSSTGSVTRVDAGAQPHWWQVNDVDGQLHFLVGTDATHWTEVARLPPADIDVSNVQIVLGALTFDGNGGDGGTSRFDNFNVCQ